MSCPSRVQRRHALVALVAMTAFLAASVVAAEIFKCVAKDPFSEARLSLA